MRVLMFGWEFPPHITGGLGTACQGLTRGLAPLVDKITFVLPRLKAAPTTEAIDLVSITDMAMSMSQSMTQDQPTTTVDDAVPGLELLPVASTLTPYINESAYQKWLQALAAHGQARAGSTNVGVASLLQLSGDYGANLMDEVIRYAAAASVVAKPGLYDIIHAHDWMTFLAGMAAKRSAGIPFIAHVHALEYDRSGDRPNETVVEVERRGMEAADRIIAVSHRTKDLAVNRYGIDPHKIDVVHNGAEPGPAPAPRGKPRLSGPLIVFLGRVTMQKGPEYFLEAARLVAKAVPDVRFAMAGHGDLLPAMVEKMAEYDLLERFHFTGFVNAKQRAALLDEAALLVMPSVSEPFGIVPLEAVAHGVPVIISKQSGVAEVLQSAIKVDFWDVRKMATAMIHIVTKSALAQQLAENATVELGDMSWDRAAQRVRQVYQEMI